jgi:hypothetical protein
MPMKTSALVLLCHMTGALSAPPPEVRQLTSKDLTESPGRDVFITVEYAPASPTLSTATMHMGPFTCWRAPS